MKQQIFRSRLVTLLFGGRLQNVLIGWFSLVAIFTLGIGAIVISRLINDYLGTAEAERVSRDMDLAGVFYGIKLDEISAISHRLVLDPGIISSFPGATAGDARSIQAIDEQITNKITVLALGGTHFVAALDSEGNILAGRTLSAEGQLSPLIVDGNWKGLPIVDTVLTTGEAQAATEVLPEEYLAQIDLDEQARIPLLNTPQAAVGPFDQREGSAGLGVVGVYPLVDAAGQVGGAVISVYMFNNDFALVDRIKEAAGVDTVTIFFGDMRVATNVHNTDQSRAVGTRVSKQVYDTVLVQAKDYSGEAFVVNDWYITRYTPLKDHQDAVVGSLYVGIRRSAFDSLVHAFNNRVLVITLVCIALAGVVAVPISKVITQPISELVAANRRLAEGDMSVQVRPYGRGELALLGESFNGMVQELQAVQQELVHKEKLASVGQLAAGVAHEINNPLASILLFADAMYHEAAEDDPARGDLKMIVDETLRCKRIVSDLLNFSRQQEILTEEVDVNALLDSVVDTLMHQGVFDNVTVERDFSPESPIIHADPAQLQQVIINLLDNAVEALEDGGRIMVTTRPLDAQSIEIQVADTGPGIPPENQAKLFTPFFTTKPAGVGTGLGLSIVYGIIKMHRGQISVKSQLGEGTTFIIVLPVRPN